VNHVYYDEEQHMKSLMTADGIPKTNCE